MLHRHNPTSLRETSWPLDLVSRLIDALEDTDKRLGEACKLLRDSAAELDHKDHEYPEDSWSRIREVLTDIDIFFHAEDEYCTAPHTCYRCDRKRLMELEPVDTDIIEVSRKVVLKGE